MPTLREVYDAMPKSGLPMCLGCGNDAELVRCDCYRPHHWVCADCVKTGHADPNFVRQMQRA